MHDSFAVYILQTLGDFNGQLFHPLFIECLEFTLLHVHLKIASRNKFGHNIDDVVIFECLKALDYSRVSALIESDCYKLELGTARLFELLLVDYLDCHFRSGNFVLRTHDGA